MSPVIAIFETSKNARVAWYSIWLDENSLEDTGLGLHDQLIPIPIHARFDLAYGSISLGDSGQLPSGATTAVVAPHALTAMLMHNHQLQLPFSPGSSVFHTVAPLWLCITQNRVSNKAACHRLGYAAIGRNAVHNPV